MKDSRRVLIDDECSEDEAVANPSEQYYTESDLKRGGSKWFTDLMNRLEKKSYTCDVDDISDTDSLKDFIDDEIIYETESEEEFEKTKPKKRLRKLSELKKSQTKDAKVKTKTVDDELPKKKKPRRCVKVVDSDEE